MAHRNILLARFIRLLGKQVTNPGLGVPVGKSGPLERGSADFLGQNYGHLSNHVIMNLNGSLTTTLLFLSNQIVKVKIFSTQFFFKYMPSNPINPPIGSIQFFAIHTSTWCIKKILQKQTSFSLK
jgi:hypothetical protein